MDVPLEEAMECKDKFTWTNLSTLDEQATDTDAVEAGGSIFIAKKRAQVFFPETKCPQAVQGLIVVPTLIRMLPEVRSSTSSLFV